MNLRTKSTTLNGFGESAVTVIMVNGTSHQDGLSAAALAGASNTMTLLTDGTGTLNVKAGGSVSNASGTATSADQRIIYDTDSGQLFYDADGSLGGAAVLFGMVAGHPPLTGADFVVV